MSGQAQPLRNLMQIVATFAFGYGMLLLEQAFTNIGVQIQALIGIAKYFFELLLDNRSNNLPEFICAKLTYVCCYNLILLLHHHIHQPLRHHDHFHDLMTINKALHLRIGQRNRP